MFLSSLTRGNTIKTSRTNGKLAPAPAWLRVLQAHTQNDLHPFICSLSVSFALVSLQLVNLFLLLIAQRFNPQVQTCLTISSVCPLRCHRCHPITCKTDWAEIKVEPTTTVSLHLLLLPCEFFYSLRTRLPGHVIVVVSDAKNRLRWSYWAPP